MRLILLHRNCCPDGSRSSLLRSALSCDPLAGLIGNSLLENASFTAGNGKNAAIALPNDWNCKNVNSAVSYNLGLPLTIPAGETAQQNHFVISNGRFVTQIDNELLDGILNSSDADVLAINVKPQLSAYRENFRFALDNLIAGCRRLYLDMANIAAIPDQWPHLLFVKHTAIPSILCQGNLPLAFADIVRACSDNKLKLSAVDVGGTVLDLETETGFMSFLTAIVKNLGEPLLTGDCNIADDARVVGKVVLGKNVTISSKAVVIGPTVISDDVTISKEAIVNASVIGKGIKVATRQVVQYRLLNDPCSDLGGLDRADNTVSAETYDTFDIETPKSKIFGNWTRFSYPRFFKRIFDFLFALLVLILFAPVFPLIALAIKINSPGPLFYTAKRQGRRGREFGCIKFRTMIIGAEKMQDNLRVVNQIDGPQFKMDDDPRISTVGRFLRDTCIDEVPQFINVLLGEISVVGPRPSPESENTLCPSWRDLRLSVRPGITGLWQICRTRIPSRDFQEWIHYDTKYVKEISLKNDLWICFKTATQLTHTFLKQF